MEINTDKRTKTTHIERAHVLTSVFLAVIVGGVTGVLALIAKNVPRKWAAIILVSAAAPSVVLLVNNAKKIILVALVADLALGIDIAVQNIGWHRGGPTGYMISLTTIALIAGYMLWIVERKPKPRFFPLVTGPALLYLLTSVISFYHSPHWQLSAFGLFLKCQAFLTYFYIVNHVSTWQDVRLIMISATVFLLLESVLMISQYLLGASLNLGGLLTSDAMEGGTGVGNRVSGTLARPGNAALYLNSLLALAFGAHLTEESVNKKLALAAFSLGLVALVATSSRGGWVSFAAAMLVMLSQLVRTETGKKAISMLLIGGLLVGALFGRQIHRRLRTAKEDKSREQLATMAYNIIEVYPLGVGENTYDLYMSDKYAHPVWVGHKLYPPHNKYLLTWAQLGLQGLAAFVLLLAAPVWQARKWLFGKANIPPHLIILTASLLGGLTAHIVHMRSETFGGLAQVQLLWLIIAMLVVANRLVVQTETTRARTGEA